MSLNDFEEKFTTIFLIDAIRPAKILLLKRSADKKIAPNLYTGTGGKIELGENQLEGARRELKEETGLEVPIQEFGRVVINKDKKILCQFFGLYDSENLPDCTEGTLEWVLVDDLDSKNIIPTAKIFLNAWAKRAWQTGTPFTMNVVRADAKDINSPIYSIDIVDGLDISML